MQEVTAKRTSTQAALRSRLFCSLQPAPAPGTGGARTPRLSTPQGKTVSGHKRQGAMKPPADSTLRGKVFHSLIPRDGGMVEIHTRHHKDAPRKGSEMKAT